MKILLLGGSKSGSQSGTNVQQVNDWLRSGFASGLPLVHP